MPRLTTPDGDYCREKCGQAPTCKRLQDGNPCSAARFYDRLREYEDTGLTPEKAAALARQSRVSPINIVGKYCTARVYASELEPSAQEQLQTLCDHPMSFGSKIRVMPDVHAGKGCVIGLTMTVEDKICPNLVGVDIGCGVLAVKLNETAINLEKLDKAIREAVPAGAAIRNTPHWKWKAVQCDLERLRCGAHINQWRAKLSIGTLGGGNHFIELDKDEQGAYWLLIHSGSRHLGLEVANYYQNAAYAAGLDAADMEKQETIAALKAAGRSVDISQALRAIDERRGKICKELACVEGLLLDDYLHDVAHVQRYAETNRIAIADSILKAANLTLQDFMSSVHNYIDSKGILRKGAVAAYAGDLLVIPLNMRDGALLCRSKGNPEWNFSAPHGAGRRMSRNEARKELSVEEFRQQMEGIYSTCIGEGTLDESPRAYKPADEIIERLEPTVEIVSRLRPVYNFKADGR